MGDKSPKNTAKTTKQKATTGAKHGAATVQPNTEPAKKK